MPDNLTGQRVKREELGGPATDGVAGGIGIPTPTDVEHRPGRAAGRHGRDHRRAGDPDRILASLALGRDAEETLPLDVAGRRDGVFVAVPGAHIEEVVGQHRLRRDGRAQRKRPSAEVLQVGSGGCGDPTVKREAAPTVIVEILWPGPAVGRRRRGAADDREAQGEDGEQAHQRAHRSADSGFNGHRDCRHRGCHWYPPGRRRRRRSSRRRR